VGDGTVVLGQAVRRHRHHVIPGVGAGADIGTVREQDARDVGMLLRDRPHERRLAANGLRVDVGPFLQQQLNDLKVGLRSNNDEEFAKEALYERIYGPEHPYGSVTLGHVKDLESITLADVKAFYKKWYLRNRVHVGLAGGYDDAFLERVMSTLGLLSVERSGTQEVPAPVAAVQAKRRALVIEKESPSVAVSFGVPLDLKRGDKDWPALWLVRAWLGPTFRVLASVAAHRGTVSHKL